MTAAQFFVGSVFLLLGVFYLFFAEGVGSAAPRPQGGASAASRPTDSGPSRQTTDVENATVVDPVPHRHRIEHGFDVPPPKSLCFCCSGLHDLAHAAEAKEHELPPGSNAAKQDGHSAAKQEGHSTSGSERTVEKNCVVSSSCPECAGCSSSVTREDAGKAAMEGRSDVRPLENSTCGENCLVLLGGLTMGFACPSNMLTMVWIGSDLTLVGRGQIIQYL